MRAGGPTPRSRLPPRPRTTACTSHRLAHSKRSDPPSVSHAPVRSSVETVIVRTGLAPEGEYDINVRRGRLEKLMATIKVDIRGAETQLLGEAGAGAGMARAGAVGGLLAGPAGIAVGVLAAKKGVVLFESKLTDGRIIVGQCTPLAYQEFLIAQRSTAPLSVAPPPKPPPTASERRVQAVVAVVLSCLAVALLLIVVGRKPSAARSMPRPPPEPPAAVPLQAQPSPADFAREVTSMIAASDGTRKTTKLAAELARVVAQEPGVSCDMAQAVADALIGKGHAPAASRLDALMRAKGCSPLKGLAPAKRRREARSAERPAEESPPPTRPTPTDPWTN